MTSPSRDPSIEGEPHLRNTLFRPDESERTAERFDAAVHSSGLNEQVEHTVWDEPGLSRELAGEVPDAAVTYDRSIAGSSFAAAGRRPSIPG